MECAGTRPGRCAWRYDRVVFLRYDQPCGAMFPAYLYAGSAGAFLCSSPRASHSDHRACSGSHRSCWPTNYLSGVSILRRERSVWWDCRSGWIPCDSAGSRRQLVAPSRRNLSEGSIDLRGLNALVYGETRAGDPGGQALGRIPLSGRDQSCSYTEVVNQQGRIRVRRSRSGALALALHS